MARQDTIGRRATTVSFDRGHIKVVYHSTAVVRFNMDEIILNRGGWKTPTTKSRMNQTSNQFMLGFTVFQKDFDWFVDYRHQTFEFEDGMTLKR